MRKFIFRISLIISLITLYLVLDTSCSNDADNDTSQPIEVIKSFGISPRGFPNSNDHFEEFLIEVSSMDNGAIMANGGWRNDLENGTDAGQIPGLASTQEQLSDIYGFFHFSVFAWRSGETVHLKIPENQTNNWTNTGAKIKFKSMLVNYAEIYMPPIIFIGNENSRYYEIDPQDYKNWIAFYNEAYDAIKDVSPNSMVGTVFNYEHISGSGILNGWPPITYWEAIELHDMSRIDIVGLTIYPFLNYATPEEVPDSYIDPLISRIGTKPIAITETGWPAEDLGGLDLLWEESEQAQLTYLSRLIAMLEGKNVWLVGWLFLYPMEENEFISSNQWQVFGSISIRNSEGNKRLVYDPWLDFTL